VSNQVNTWPADIGPNPSLNSFSTPANEPLGHPGKIPDRSRTDGKLSGGISLRPEGGCLRSSPVTCMIRRTCGLGKAELGTQVRNEHDLTYVNSPGPSRVWRKMSHSVRECMMRDGYIYIVGDLGVCRHPHGCGSRSNVAQQNSATPTVRGNNGAWSTSGGGTGGRAGIFAWILLRAAIDLRTRVEQGRQSGEIRSV